METCQRSFYVGEDITQEDIKAKFEDGVLKLEIPKKEAKPEVKEETKASVEKKSSCKKSASEKDDC